MASVVASENWASINNDNVFEGIEISGVDSAFLMSLMGELQDHVEESDEERLKSVIQSLEAEINSCMEPADDPDHASISDGEDSQTCKSVQLDDHDCSTLFDHDLDMSAWIDMEAVPCSPRNDLNWYMYPCDDEISSNCFVNDGNFLGVALDQEPAYNCLWKDSTYDLMMYD